MVRRQFGLIITGMGLCAFACLPALPARADAVAGFYKGKGDIGEREGRPWAPNVSGWTDSAS